MDKELDRLLAPCGLETPPQSRKNAVRAAIRRHTVDARARLGQPQVEDEDARFTDKLLAQALEIERAPAGLRAKTRQRIREITASQQRIEQVPPQLRARVHAQVSKASEQARTGVAARWRRYGAFALVATIVLGVAVSMLLQREPDVGGINTLGGQPTSDKVVRERICALMRAGKNREAREEFDKHLRRSGPPASAAEIYRLCRP